MRQQTVPRVHDNQKIQLIKRFVLIMQVCNVTSSHYTSFEFILTPVQYEKKENMFT